MNFSQEFKKSIVEKLLSNNSPGIAALSIEAGVSKKTIYNWKQQFCYKADLNGVKPQRSPRNWSHAERFKALMETFSLTEEQLGKWLREKGLHSQHLELWRKEMENQIIERKEEKELKVANKKIHNLESEIQKKDKTISELMTMLMIKKKFPNIWEDGE